MQEARLPREVQPTREVEVRFNHLELTFPRGGLDEDTRTDIDSFYQEIFGWRSSDTPVFGQTNHLLHASGQDLVLAEADEPMLPSAQPLGYGPGETVFTPHLGVEVNFDEVAPLLAECQRYQEKDPRVQLFEFPPTRYGGLKGVHHGFLLMYLLPMRFEVFGIKWDQGGEPEMTWRYLKSS